MRKIKSSDFDRLFDEGKTDLTPYLDTAKLRKVHGSSIPRRINVDLPSWMIDRLDRAADHIGVTRQSLIKLWLHECLSDKISLGPDARHNPAR